MLFTTLEFVAFLVCALAAYYLLPKRLQWYVLLGVSLLFYAGLGRRRIVFILLSAVSTWAAANLLGKLHTREKAELCARKDSLDKPQKTALKKRYLGLRRWVVAGFVALNLGGLLFFKFFNLAAETTGLFKTLPLIMPVGISFYTLQILGYVLDVHNKKVQPEPNLLKTMLFTLYFPQVIQGPISRFSEIGAQLTAEHAFDYDRFVLGLLRMLWGYFKKLVIADRFAPVVAALFDNYTQYSGFQVLFVAVLYVVQLYADFSGGIDIALGASELFGVTLPENFNRPLFSKSISEFWRRWHITLGTWLRDYVFYPVTLSKPLAKLGKWLSKHCGKWFGKWIPAYISLFALWFCSGVWHGEGAQFILYGLYHGTLIMLGMTFMPLFDKLSAALHVDRSSQTWKVVRVARTFFFVTVGEIIFRSGSVSQALYMIRSLFSAWNPWVLFDGFIYTLNIEPKDFWVGALAMLVLLLVSLANRKGSVRRWVKERELPLRWGLCLGAIACVVVFGVYGPGYDAVPFIYFQF